MSISQIVWLVRASLITKSSRYTRKFHAYINSKCKHKLIYIVNYFHVNIEVIFNAALFILKFPVHYTLSFTIGVTSGL